MNYRGSTREIYNEHYNSSSTLEDVTSATVDIIDPDSTVIVDDGAMTKTATGKYSYFHTISTSGVLGWWTYQITMVDTNGYIFIDIGGFEVGSL
jgi:hypothetical protein